MEKPSLLTRVYMNVLIQLLSLDCISLMPTKNPLLGTFLALPINLYRTMCDPQQVKLLTSCFRIKADSQINLIEVNRIDVIVTLRIQMGER